MDIPTRVMERPSDNDLAPSPASRILTGAQYGWITLAYVLFVIYGSLVPLTFRAIPFERGWARFTTAMARPVALSDPSDWLANVLLFIPLGFIAMAWRRIDRPGRGLGTFLWVLPACTLLSAALEFVQLWFPPRHTSKNDIVAETMGGAIGIGIWLTAGQGITAALAALWATHARSNWSIRLMPGYLILLVVIHGMPFDLTLSPSSLRFKHRHHDRLVRPVPFTVVKGESFDLVKKGAINIAWFLPAGVLLAGLPGSTWRGRGSAGRVFAAGLALAVGIEIMQLFVVSRYYDATDIITGSLAVLAGWRIMRAWQDCGERADDFLAWRASLALVWLAALVWFHWAPFDFGIDADFLAGRWRESGFLSYAGHERGGNLYVVNDLIQKTLLFLPFGLLLSSRSERRGYLALAAVGAFVLSLALEAGEFCSRQHRQPGVSDLFVEPFGAVLGCLAVRRLRDFKRSAASEATPAPVRTAPLPIAVPAPLYGSARSCSNFE